MQKPLVFVGAGMYWFVAWRDEEKRKKREREKREGVDEPTNNQKSNPHGRAREPRASERGIGAGTYHLREGVIFPSASIAVLSKPASKLDAAAASRDAKNESPDEKATAACWTGRVGFQNALTVLPAKKVTKSARKMFFIMVRLVLELI